MLFSGVYKRIYYTTEIFVLLESCPLFFFRPASKGLLHTDEEEMEDEEENGADAEGER